LRGRAIAQCFAKERFATKRELNNLSRLAVDASQIFPPDFVSATASHIHTTVRLQKITILLLLTLLLLLLLLTLLLLLLCTLLFMFCLDFSSLIYFLHSITGEANIQPELNESMYVFCCRSICICHISSVFSSMFYLS
jgi:hypothetical protein